MNKEVLALFEMLDQKNGYLLEFHQMNLDEINKLNQGCTDHFETFYYNREVLLNAIDKLDRKLSINRCSKMNRAEKKKLVEILNIKKDMVLSILEQDLMIMSLLEQLKNKIPSLAS